MTQLEETQRDRWWGGMNPLPPGSDCRAARTRRPARFGRARRVILAVVALAAMATACGDDQAAGADSTIAPTIGSSTDDSGQPTDTGLDGPTTTQAEVIGPVLAIDASPSDILTAVEEAHGPTSDATGQILRFADFPALDTPEGTEITELRADARTTADGQTITIAELTLTVALASDDVVMFYQDQLDELGWTTALDVPPTSGSLPYRLTFDAPDSTYPRDDLEIIVSPLDARRSLARLHYAEQLPADQATLLERLGGWAVGLPLPPGGQVTGAGIQTSSEGRLSLHYTLTVGYSDATPADLAEELRQALPTPEFSIDPKPPTGDQLDNWVYLTSSFFSDARVSPHGPSGEGPILVNVNARVEFTPR